jgi:zinc/manganese transport system ATP-binding protein
MAITARNLTLGYDRLPAVHHLDCTIAPGTLTAVVGPNGAGKSTFLKAIGAGLKPLGGEIATTARRIAYLPQQAEVDRSFPIDVRGFVAMGLWAEIGAFGRLRQVHEARIDAALHAVGLGGFDRRAISALSGGQMQRVMFARLLLQDADLILLDEPFTALDDKTAADLIDLVRQWHGEGRTVLAVLHDHELVRAHFPQTLLLARRKIAHGATAQVLTAENLFRARQMQEPHDTGAHACLEGAA